jgi:carboxypeptidase Taq
MTEKPWDLLLARMADLRGLQGAIAILSWDQETYLPPRGARARGEHLSTLQGLLHEKLTAPELGDALAAVEAAEGQPPDGGAMLGVLRFERDRALGIPARLVRELAAAQSAALVAWREAREASAFPIFAPHLERLLALRREMADALLPTLARGPAPGPDPERYDALLEGYEEGMRVARLEPLFEKLAGWLVPLVHRLASSTPPSDPLAGRRFDGEAQWSFSLELLDAMGFERDAGRLDRSVHPFTISADPGDVRLTTRICEELPCSSVFSALHEGGHGLYEQGLPAETRRTSLCAAASMGLHESQSRLWENLVGRSLPFWRHFYPRMQARFPALADVSLVDFHRSVNRVQRSLIRVEADEVTYNLHIALRFELELALLRGRLAVKDLPAAWNDRTQALLGLRPARDAEGVLQDIHWAWGELGYFPTYTIGNLYAASLFAAARREVPRLEEEVAAGRLLPLRDWLRERVHRVGRALPAEEIVRRATGRGLCDDDFRAYLEAKHDARPGDA